ncbi:MAG: formylmethanofuran dehydrogenase subunit C [Planctomycetia bacterium]|nr:formylmethanofuran dehydrogenase subunit C [Planctomycetia bacterium]
MTLKLDYTGQTPIPVEVEGLTPDEVRGQSLAEIEQFEIQHGNEKLPLAAMFRVSGDPADGRIEFSGNLSGVHWIGAGMTDGEIHLAGPAGRHVGSEMTGGTITVDGDASDWVGGEMHGGLIHVRGQAGHLVGAAYRGSRRGMTGGTILIDGDAGNEIGLTMRRGLIAVGGAGGDVPGFNMIAGTILVLGESGIRPGAAMRRGTIGLLGSPSLTLLPTFRAAGRCRPLVLSLVFRQLQSLGFVFDADLLTAEYRLFHGDLLEGGRGEILLRA